MAASQFLHGDPRPVMVPFDQTDTTITFEPGSLVCITSGNLTNLGTATLAATIATFAGVVAQKKTAGITGTALRIFGNNTDGQIRVDTAGEFAFDRSDTIALNVGDYMSPDGVTANTLKRISTAGTASLSVGVVREYAPETGSGIVGRVRIRLLSRMLPSANPT